MNNHQHVITAREKRWLSALYGKTLKLIEGYRFDFDHDDNKTTFYSTARLHMKDGGAYDLKTTFVHVDITDDFWDDVGEFHFGSATGDIWAPEGIDTFKLTINRKIDEVLLVNDHDVLKHGEEVVGRFAFTKAILLRSGESYISLAMDDFCEDAIVVRTGRDRASLVPDDSGSWYEKPGWTDDYTRAYESI